MTKFLNNICLIAFVAVGITLFNIIPSIAFGTASFVIAGKNWDATCDGDMMRLPVWLVVTGSVSIGFAVIQLILIVSALCMSMVKKVFFIPFITPYIIIAILYFLFNVAWVIVGGVALFRDGSECKDVATSLWAMSLTMFIVLLLNITGLHCLNVSLKFNQKDSDSDLSFKWCCGCLEKGSGIDF